jgi:hypothetical protein
MATKKQPHPYADVIKAWADGCAVQVKVRDKWVDVSIHNPSFNKDCDWRIKPVDDAPQNYFEQFKAICNGIVDGRTIQYRTRGSNDEWRDNQYRFSQSLFSFNLNVLEFRVKPNTKTIRYQNYRTKCSINTWCDIDKLSKSDLEEFYSFIEWIGEEQSIIIEVDDE